jgi:spore coat protein A
VLNRRTFLKISAAASSLNLVQPLFGAQANVRSLGAVTLDRRISRYIDPLPILPVLNPSKKTANGTDYNVELTQFQVKLHSELKPTDVWGYGGKYPGPTIEATMDEAVSVRWQNRLPRRHLFPIDPKIHGAMPPAPEVRTVTHLHGARTRSEHDGLPESWITPGQSATYVYPNHQQAATLWYHDHALGITRLNNYAGLSGFYLLRDRQEKQLNLPHGDFEICLLIQDRTLDEKGQLLYAPTAEDGSALPQGVWGPEFFGQLPLVNGAIYPYLDVEPRPYRLRILNASNSRFFHLNFNLAKTPQDIPNFVPFVQIGSDGGLLPKPARLEKVLLAPAERADVVIDFSNAVGKIVTINNDARSPYPGWLTPIETHPPLEELMQIRVRLPLSSTKALSIPETLPFSPIPQSPQIKSRDFVLAEILDKNGQSLGVRIDGKRYDEPVTEEIKLGSIEKWRFINTTDDAHPMHLHLVQFQILERQGFDALAWRTNQLKLVGKVRLPAANEQGWKDTAVVNRAEVLTILVRFDGYPGRYVYHCHMLEHEDNDMMRPYSIVL